MSLMSQRSVDGSLLDVSVVSKEREMELEKELSHAKRSLLGYIQQVKQLEEVLESELGIDGNIGDADSS